MTYSVPERILAGHSPDCQMAPFNEQHLDVAHLLPALSTYLGHVSPATTYWYLQACPLLMTAAASP
jgi:hypothetical protein